MLLTLMIVAVGPALPAPARIDWKADPVWTEHYDRGMQALKEQKYVRATGWLERAVARAEGFGPSGIRTAAPFEQRQASPHPTHHDIRRDGQPALRSRRKRRLEACVMVRIQWDYTKSR